MMSKSPMFMIANVGKVKMEAKKTLLVATVQDNERM